MATVIRCDACDQLAGHQVVSASFVVGGMALSNGVESQFFASDRPNEYLVCASCAEYIEQCIDVLLARQPERVNL
jgi:hypothetical protein